MTNVLVLYYSSYGHIETMAYAVAEGARAGGATVDVKRVPEIVPEAVAKASHFKLDQPAPIATVDELPSYDAIVVGAPTRFGRMPSAMGSFCPLASRGSPGANGRDASGQIPPSRTKVSPSRTKKTGSDFLGFLRPIRGFSMGYEQSKSKNFLITRQRQLTSGAGRAWARS